MSSLNYVLQGAHIYHWQPSNQTSPVIFCSKDALFQKGKAIRGGVPICWPWFGPNGDKGQHGFARISDWKLEEDQIEDAKRKLIFSLAPNEETKHLFPYNFELTYEILEEGNTLTLTLTTKNIYSQAFPVSPALHTYFKVGDVRQITVEGLQGSSYIDKTKNGIAKIEDSSELKVNAEVDRVYLSSQTNKLIDPILQRIIYIDHQASATVVWNPWIEKAKAMTDLKDEEYLEFICIESVYAPEEQILAPNESLILKQSISVENVTPTT